MSRMTKPYRRYRARGREGAVGGGMDELRALRAREAGDGPPPPGGGPDQRPLPSARPSRQERRRRRELQRQGRRWWSLRGLGPAGWIGRIAILLLLAVIAWAGFGWLAIDGAVDEANSKITDRAKAALDPAPGGMLGTPTNTLIIGVDKRKGRTRSRADTLLLMRTDPDEGRIKYLSIPRDYRVELPGQGTQKINASFFFGGQAGAIRAVQRLTGVPVHHIIVIKFNGFPKMVDAVGGVTVNNPTALVECPYENRRTVSFPEGRIELNGARALEYARARQGACGGDFGRALRQQAVVAAMKGKVLSPSNIWRAPWRGADVVRALQTDIGTMDMIKMGWLQARLDQRPGDRILLSGEILDIDGVSYVVQTDPDQNEREIAKFMGPA
jgi:polyisoprenyl-teichoic acid--peptidoglycan teichoic acid transferase